MSDKVFVRSGTGAEAVVEIFDAGDPDIAFYVAGLTAGKIDHTTTIITSAAEENDMAISTNPVVAEVQKKALMLATKIMRYDLPTAHARPTGDSGIIEVEWPVNGGHDIATILLVPTDLGADGNIAAKKRFIVNNAPQAYATTEKESGEEDGYNWTRYVRWTSSGD
jgi:hypothetical protein